MAPTWLHVHNGPHDGAPTESTVALATAEFTTASTGATVTSKQTTNKPSADAAAGNDGDGDTASDSGAVVGAVVGALAALAMVIAAAVMILQRRRPEEHDDAARPTAISNADFDGGESGEGGDGFGTWPLKRVAGSVHATDLAEPDYDRPAGDDMYGNTAAVPEPVYGVPEEPSADVYGLGPVEPEPYWRIQYLLPYLL